MITDSYGLSSFRGAGVMRRIVGYVAGVNGLEITAAQNVKPVHLIGLILVFHANPEKCFTAW